MAGVAENFEGTAELLGAEVGVEGEEDLDHGDGAIVALFNCTHFVCGVRGVAIELV